MIICYKKARYGVRKKRNIFIVTISIVSWALKNILISPVQSLKIRITASKFLTNRELNFEMNYRTKIVMRTNSKAIPKSC